jgi:hypothetical protein
MSQETNYAEPITEDFDDNDGGYSPLDAPVKQRAYTKPNIDEADIVGDLEVPTFERPSFSDIDDEDEPAPEPERPFNPSYSELDGKEKTMGAEMMADMTLDIYEKACGWIGKIPQISESKLDKLIVEGEIDADITLPTQAGEMPVKEFAQEYNNSIKDAFDVSDEFKEKVRPPLVRVFKKRGIGMTDEQLLGYYFLTDLGAKGAQAFMLRKQANSILDALKENTIEMRETRMRSERPATPPNYSTTNSQPTTQATTQNEDLVDYTADISSVTSTEANVPKRRKPKTNLEEQLENFNSEPVYDNLKDNGGFKQDFQNDPTMPTFGDKSILAELDRLSGQDSEPPKRRASRGKGSPRKKR